MTTLREQLHSLHAWLTGAIRLADFIYVNLSLLAVGAREMIACRRAGLRVVQRLCESLLAVRSGVSQGVLGVILGDAKALYYSLLREIDGLEASGHVRHLRPGAWDDFIAEQTRRVA